MRAALVAFSALGLLCCSTTRAGRADDPGVAVLSLQVKGGQREYHVVAPPDATSPRPLVILLHGNGAAPEDMTGASGRPAPYRIWRELAARDGFYLAIPRGERGGNRKSGWNDCRRDATSNPTVDDVAFVAKLIDAMSAAFAIDRHRVYVTGSSNGGHMAIRIGIELADEVAAIAPVAAAMPADSKCAAPSPMPILFMNGTRDPISPYEGGTIGRTRDGRGTVRSAADTLAFWIGINGGLESKSSTALPDRDSGDSSRVTREAFATASGDEVVLYRIDGGGHTEPSTRERYTRFYERFVGRQNHDIEMAVEIWNFFKDKTR